jgi:thermitase
MLVGLLLTATTLAPAAGVASGPAGLPQGPYVVGFFGQPPVGPGDTYFGAQVTGVNDAVDFAAVDVRDGAEFQAGVLSDPRVRYYQPDAPLMVAQLVPNDPQYGNQYDLKPATTDAQTAWDTTLGSTSAKVCITDTGVRASHEDFVGTTFYFWKDEVGGQANAYDDNGHGTHVTGTVAAVINNGKGIAGAAQVSIGNAKVLNNAGSGTFTQVANGVTDCTGSGAHVISMSLGCAGPVGSTCDNQAMHDAVTAAYNAGILVVAAAGNSGPCNNCVGLPAAYPEAVAITCTDANNNFCSFSSQGPEAFVSAPGSSIVSTYANSDTSYATLSGTSMSTPHVSAEAALLKTLNPTWDRVNIKSQIQSTATDLGPNGKDDQFGYGLIHYCRAVGGTCGGGGGATAPDAPQNLAARHHQGPNSGRIKLTWSAPGSDGGSPVTNYEVYRGTTAGGEGFLTEIGNVLSYVDSGLARGTTYYYKVSAKNAVGEGPQSNEASAVG